MLEYCRLTMLWWFEVNSKGAQPSIHMYPFSPRLLSSQAAAWHWAELPVLDSRSLLVLHVKHSSVSMSIPNSLTIPFPILPPGNHKVITEYWAESPVLDSRSLLVLHVTYSSVSMSIPHSLTYLFPLAIMSFFSKSCARLFLFCMLSSFFSCWYAVVS